MYKYIKSPEYKSGKALLDVLVVTKKGVERGGLFKGVIIPTTLNEDVRDIIRDFPGPVWKAQHANGGADEMLVYVSKDGLINRFGWYLILGPCPVNDTGLDIGGPGWLKRTPVKSIEELKRMLKTK